MVAKIPGFVEEKDFGCPFCAIGLRDFLALVSEVKEVEVFLAGSRFHGFKVIFWIFCGVVSVYCDELHAFRSVVRLDLNHTVFPSPDIGAVITTEYHSDSRIPGIFLHAMVGPIHTREIEWERFIADFQIRQFPHACSIAAGVILKIRS